MDSNFFSQLEADAEMVPSDDKLLKINTLYRMMVETQKIIADLENRLEREKQALRKITDFDLPTAMSEAGCKKFVTDEGFQLEVKPFYTAKIDDENRESCFSWLRSHNHDGIIKHQLAANFNKGEDKTVREIVDVFKQYGVSYTDKETVHHQTLTAFVKERIEKGEEFPLETFKVFIGQTTKVKMV